MYLICIGKIIKFLNMNTMREEYSISLEKYMNDDQALCYVVSSDDQKIIGVTIGEYDMFEYINPVCIVFI